MTIITRIAPDVGWLPISFVNVYFIGRPGGAWTLVDAGLPGRANQIIEAAEARFGAGARPEAIVLTHGHFDHAGSALPLAEYWDVPVYAHRLEMPYLTGKSGYPPPDPTIGGAMAFLSRFMPSGPRNLTGRIHELQPNEVPGAAGLGMAGHARTFARAHLALSSIRSRAAGRRCFRDHEYGFVERPGDRRRTLSRACAPFNTDWEATRLSVKELAKLRPNVAGCGHGIPRCDADLPARLERFAEMFRTPERGVMCAAPRARTSTASSRCRPRHSIRSRSRPRER